MRTGEKKFDVELSDGWIEYGLVFSGESVETIEEDFPVVEVNMLRGEEICDECSDLSAIGVTTEK